VDVVPLDMSIPFSAGRARNEGFHYIISNNRDLEYIQFIDGDCELCEGWLEFAVKKLEQNHQWAVAAGRVKERFPEKSIYNLLCDIEWNTPTGETKSCGGIFMVKKKRFQDVNGFNISLIAGEEPELCYRLRQNGWQIYRLDHLMVLHDAAITKFSQWWKRAVRGGFGGAQIDALQVTGSEKYCSKDMLSILFWALFFPGLILSLALLFSQWWSLLFTVYLFQTIKIAITINRHLSNWKHSFYYAVFVIIRKWPAFLGELLFLAKKVLHKPPTIIEYK